jgi:hypothetical protein
VAVTVEPFMGELKEKSVLANSTAGGITQQTLYLSEQWS